MRKGVHKMKTIFMTGFPGFLAEQLTEQLLQDYGEQISHFYFLVLRQEKERAEQTLQQLTYHKKINREQISIVLGDITKQDLGVEQTTFTKLLNEVTHVFHLAAIYDLAVPEEIAELVNVKGTNYVNQFVTQIKTLERYIYFSTAYVSGKREGIIYEHELDEGQSFRNHYERTKFSAEKLVQEIKENVPTTIIRPGVVKGHSITGETIKFDGLYFLLNFYDRLRYLPFIPYLKDGDAYPQGNFVPSDYVIKGTTYLALNPVGEGKTYHLTDPNPYNMGELQEFLLKEFLGRKPKGTIPITLAKLPLSCTIIRNWLRVEKEAMDYFTYHSIYNASEAKKDLESAGIYCPDLKDTVSSMVQFYRKYKDDQTKHLPIFFTKNYNN